MRAWMLIVVLAAAMPLRSEEGVTPTASATLTQDQVLTRYYEEAVGQGNFEVIDSLFDEAFETDAAVPGLKKGREGLKGFLKALRTAFPDAKLEVIQRVSQGGTVACRYKFSGTHTAKFFGIKATKKKASVSGVDIWEFKDGKVVGQHGNFDSLGLLVQLGIAPELK